MPRYNTECIVLKSINYKDADKIYTLFSKNKGKFTALAKGVRKLSSRRSGNLDTLNHIVVGINEAENNFKYITEVACKNSFKNLKDNLETSVKGFYFAELVHRFVEEGQENPEVFELLLKSIKLLNQVSSNPDLLDSHTIVNYFEVSLMKHLGYEMPFDKLVLSDNEEKFLYALSKGKLIKDSSLDSVALKNVDALIKSYIRDILEDNFRTTRVFGAL